MDAQARFEQLKQKYEPVLRYIDEQQIAIQGLDVRDGKLLIRIAVPSDDVRERVMDRINRINPSGSDVVPDIRVENVNNVTNTGQSTVHSGEQFSHQGEMPPR